MIDRDEAIRSLRSFNPRAREDDLAFYADSYLAYREASANIAEHGNIVAHPRTAAPIENPYLRVRSQAMSSLLKLRRVKNVAPLWEFSSWAVLASQPL